MTPSFLRHTPADPASMEAQIARAREGMAGADDAVTILDRAGDLAAMLTAARREQEARDLLLPLLASAREHAAAEPAGWYVLALATASQYLDLREEANALFGEGLALARAHGWERLEHFVLHHWGRSLAEEGDIEPARDCFTQSLAIRTRRNESKLIESSQRALRALQDLPRP
jgi:tetratricopeptide (TPR) repeat protein